MRALGVPPRKEQLGEQFTTDFLKNLADRHKVFQGSANPTTTQIPQGEWVLWKNTTTGEVRLWLNDGGTLKSVVLTSSSTNIPAFIANGSTSTIGPAATYVNVVLTTESIDTANCFNGTRWTPPVAGIYQINGSIQFDGSTLQSGRLIALRKNGTSSFAGMAYSTADSNAWEGLSCSGLVYLNGTTDYVTLTGYVAAGTAAGQLTDAYFSGVLVRAG